MYRSTSRRGSSQGKGIASLDKRKRNGPVRQNQQIRQNSLLQLAQIIKFSLLVRTNFFVSEKE